MLHEDMSLQDAIKDALEDPDNLAKTKKAHATFLRETVILPVRKTFVKRKDPIPLYLEDEGARFLPIFTDGVFFNQWAKDEIDNMDCLYLTGNDLIKGTGDEVYICLDIGQAHYKQFSPEEIKQLQMIVAKLESLIKKNTAS